MSRIVRQLAAGVFAFVGTVLLVVGGISAWVLHTVHDTDLYVAAADRIWAEPQIQQTLNDRLAESIMSAINPEERIAEWLGDLVDQGMDPILAAQVLRVGGNLEERLTPAVRELVEAGTSTDTFASAWSAAVRYSHKSLLAYLRGQTDTIIGDDQGALVFRLDVALGSVRLPDQLGSLLPSIPIESTTVEIASAQTMGKAQKAYQTVSTAATWFPWVGLAMASAAVVLSRRRLRLTLTVVTIVLLAAVAVFILERVVPHVLLGMIIDSGSQVPL